MSDVDESTRFQDPQVILRALHSARTIAIVGLSPNELRGSNFVGFYLKRHGYEVIPVNPRESEILGMKCYPTLADILGSGGGPSARRCAVILSRRRYDQLNRTAA